MDICISAGLLLEENLCPLPRLINLLPWHPEEKKKKRKRKSFRVVVDSRWLEIVCSSSHGEVGYKSPPLEPRWAL